MFKSMLGSGLLVCLAACSSQPAVTNTIGVVPSATPSSGNASVSINSNLRAQVTVPANVQAMDPRCDQTGPEQCNGIDDNCNGIIDENCGYQSGAIQVTLSWNTASDLDLHVVDPSNEEIYYGNRTSASGGQLDHDANSACTVQPPTVENVFWSRADPPRGTYQVRLVAFDMCGVGNTPAVLSIAVGGRVVGTWQLGFGQQREYTIPFTVR